MPNARYLRTAGSRSFGILPEPCLGSCGDQEPGAASNSDKVGETSAHRRVHRAHDAVEHDAVAGDHLHVGPIRVGALHRLQLVGQRRVVELAGLLGSGFWSSPTIRLNPSSCTTTAIFTWRIGRARCRGPCPSALIGSRASCVQTAVISRNATMQVSRSMYGTRFNRR